ncbi:MAG: glucuronate isomerase [Bacteroidales bacterium]|nr:glucuronate isomerase [Bacteroidales bacterium]
MPFITEDFLLGSPCARELYHNHAERMPIIDYHCHLSPKLIAENVKFPDITSLWLVEGHSGDHYKWRAMRACGVSEDYITGSRSPWEKFQKWAETVPHTMRNPLYHWTHLELKRVFGIDKLLTPDTAREIFEQCNAMLASDDFSTQSLIRRFNVHTLCTTDDPADDLRWHRHIALNPFGTAVLPAWRPDAAMAIDNPQTYRSYLERLSQAVDIEIGSYAALIEALRKRHDYFRENGCVLSDHGMDTFHAADYTDREVEAIFAAVLKGHCPDPRERDIFMSAFLHDMAVMDAEDGWAQQFHIGPLRNNNSRMFAAVGPDTGFDAIGDLPCAAAGHRFFDSLEREGKLAKTIVYPLNPKDNEVLMAMAYTFNDGSVPGKMQFGSAWWFLDHEYGMRTQIDLLSSQGLLSRFVGMLTDSRSFISYPRHEYFRRILCDVLGADIASGRLPSSEMEFIGGMVEDICFRNAAEYFGFRL